MLFQQSPSRRPSDELTVLPDLASEPSSTLSRLPVNEAAAKAPEGARKDVAATSSMSEGEFPQGGWSLAEILNPSSVPVSNKLLSDLGATIPGSLHRALRFFRQNFC